jgi:hypothetical protein
MPTPHLALQITAYFSHLEKLWQIAQHQSSKLMPPFELHIWGINK